MKRTLAMLLALALQLLCACSAAPEPTQPAAEPPVETAETLPDHAAQDDAASEPAQPLFWQVSGNGYSGSFNLHGSIHVSDGLTYPQELLDAYAACDTLAVESDVLALEADLSAQVEMMGGMQKWASTYPLFLWGPIACGFYIVLAVAFGFMIHIRGRDKQKFSEACRPLLGSRVDGVWGRVIDLTAIFALIAGTETTFSLATQLQSRAISRLFGLQDIIG